MIKYKNKKNRSNLRTLNKVLLIGKLIDKPILKKDRRNNSFCKFSLVTKRERKTRNREKKIELTNHTCLVWGKLAEICYKLLDKESLVFVEGRVTEKKNSRGFFEAVILVKDIVILGDRKEQYGDRYFNR